MGTITNQVLSLLLGFSENGQINKIYLLYMLNGGRGGIQKYIFFSLNNSEDVKFLFV